MNGVAYSRNFMVFKCSIILAYIFILMNFNRTFLYKVKLN